MRRRTGRVPLGPDQAAELQLVTRLPGGFLGSQLGGDPIQDRLGLVEAPAQTFLTRDLQVDFHKPGVVARRLGGRASREHLLFDVVRCWRRSAVSRPSERESHDRYRQ